MRRRKVECGYAATLQWRRRARCRPDRIFLLWREYTGHNDLDQNSVGFRVADNLKLFAHGFRQYVMRWQGWVHGWFYWLKLATYIQNPSD
ncbi:MAG: hypothetical protein NZ820_05420 [Dehalococcoidia bacterium]|nr:hypothetical protein [Dehalococcoidia bacterium]